MEGLFVSDAEIHEEAFTSFLPAMEFQDLSWPEDVEEIEREDPPLQPEQQQNHVLMIEEGIMPDWSVQLSNDYMPNVDLEYIAKMHIETVLPKLRSLLPANVIQSLGQPPSTLGARGIYNRFYDQLLFSAVSNNFAGLRDVPMTTILQYAKMNWRTKAVTKFMSCTSNPAAKSFTNSLLRCTIEARDAEMLDLLLSGPFGLDVDQHIRSAHGGTYSLIERAASLHDWTTVRMLLKRRANIHETNGVSNGRSMLRYATQPDFAGDSPLPLDKDLIEELLEAGAEVDSDCVRNVIRAKDSATFERLVFVHPQHAKEWLKKGMFHDALEILHNEAADRLVDFLFESGISGADLEAFSRSSDCMCFIEIAAKASNLELVAKLHGHSVPLTQKTLFIAVKNEDWVLVEMLFREDMNIGLIVPDYADDDHDIYDGRRNRKMWNAIDRAIMAGQMEISAALLSENARTALHFARHHATLELAVEEGNEIQFRSLLHSLQPVFDGSRIDPKKIDKAYDSILLGILYCTIRPGQHGLANLLIETLTSARPASTTFALRERMTPKDASIIRSILDAKIWWTGALSKALVMAVEWGEMAIINDLLVAGADVDGAHDSFYMRSYDDETDWHGGSTLAIAIETGDISMVEFLLATGAHINASTSQCGGDTPLFLAVKSQDIAMVRLLLARGARALDSNALAEALATDIELFAVLCEHCSRCGFTAFAEYIPRLLIQAIRGGNMGHIIRLLEFITRHHQSEHHRPGLWSHSVAYEGDGPETPLDAAISAASPDRLKLVQMLLDAGNHPDAIISIHEWDFDGIRSGNCTALMAAIRTQDIALVQILLRHGANVNHPVGLGVQRTPLQTAAELGDVQLVQLLIDEGAYVNSAPAYNGGATALQLTAAGGYIGIAELLIQNGADVNGPIAKVHGKSALEAAAEHGRLHMVLFLLQQGADLDLNQTSGQVKAIESAKLNGHRGVVQLLESWVERVRSITNAGRRRLNNSTPEVHIHEQWNENDTLIATIDDLQDVDNTTPPSKGRTCRECNAGLSNPSALARHIKTVHKKSRANGTAKFKCSSCNYSTNRKDTYRKHRAIHTRE